MKRIFAFLLALMLLLCFSSCSGSDLASVKQDGVLIVGVTEYEPMDYRDSDGNWAGFDAELVRLTAEKLGVKAQFVIINWDEKVDKLKSKEIDCVWNGYTVNDVDNVSFSDAYAKNSSVLVVRTDKSESIKSIEDIEGLSVSYEKGSSSERIVNELKSDFDKSPVPLQKEALYSVQKGEVDACIVDKTIFDSLVHTDLIVVHTFESEKFAVGFREGSDLVQEINGILKELKTDGILASLASKYKVELT